MSQKEIVIVLGASNKEDRYSNIAIKLLLEKGHTVIPVHPKLSKIDNLKVENSLLEIREQVDTVAMYVNPQIGQKYKDEIINLAPKRVIFNPGTESEDLKKCMEEEGIVVQNACTLVLLNTNQY